MSRTSDEELGRRRFQLVKERAVEDAIEKIRHAPGSGWQSLRTTDYTLIREILGELWIGLEQERWEQYSFSTRTQADIRDLLTLGACHRGRTYPRSLLERMDAILSHKPDEPREP